MTPQEACESLRKHLTKNPDDEGIFNVYEVNGELVIYVEYIYRAPEAKAIGDSWEGYPVKIGRISCW